jgi:2-iminobutanoate/2-iminopropanoate deaminase
MAEKEPIVPQPARTGGPPYTPGIRAAGFIFVSGQVGVDASTGRVVEGVAAQTRACLENVRRVLETGGSSLDRVVKTTVFLANIGDFAAMNEVYRSFFNEPLPARSTVEAKLARPELLVEIEAIALA